MRANASLIAAPPVAKRVPTRRVHHGDVFVDHYEWLRDKDNPEVISYLEAENAYTEAQTTHLSELSESIFNEIKSRTKETDLSVPTYTSHPGGSAYWYYVRTVEGSEYPIYCRVVAEDRQHMPDPEQQIVGEEVLLDGNLEAEGHEFFALGAFSVSLDGRLLAYSTDLTGAERFTIMIKDLVSGELLAEQICSTPERTRLGGLTSRYGIGWVPTHHKTSKC
jgi:oligopeptidase B